MPWLVAPIGADLTDAVTAVAMLEGDQRRKTLWYAGSFAGLGVAASLLVARR